MYILGWGCQSFCPCAVSLEDDFRVRAPSLQRRRRRLLWTFLFVWILDRFQRDVERGEDFWGWRRFCVCLTKTAARWAPLFPAVRSEIIKENSSYKDVVLHWIKRSPRPLDSRSAISSDGKLRAMWCTINLPKLPFWRHESTLCPHTRDRFL